MRDAYEHDKRSQRDYSLDSNSDRSYQSSSNKSYSTAPSSHSSSSAKRRPIVDQEKRPDIRREEAPARFLPDKHPCEEPDHYSRYREAPIETASFSTVGSDDDEEEDDIPEYDPPEYTLEKYEPSAIPARPADFSELFPSHRRLDIRHDDSTSDGNMNLRVDTEVSIQGRKHNMTLFHLRMHDLRNREFSLRRYCRDSGREVCHSVRKHQKPAAERRPGIHRSLSNAIHSMRPKLERTSSGSSTIPLKRHDSGYGSMHSTDEDYRPVSAGSATKAPEQPLTNSIKLEFSNYAQVGVNLTKDKKRYEFDYWGYEFAWKRISQKDSKEVSFHLIDKKSSNKKVLAYIRPIPLTDEEAKEERKNGGWIPQCMMWIADDAIVRASKDVSDAIVAAGLMALVDDSIRSHFHSEESKLLLIPSKLNMGVEYVGPTRLINEMFGRKDSRLDSRSEHAFGDGPSKASRVTSASVRPSSRDY